MSNKLEDNKENKLQEAYPGVYAQLGKEDQKISIQDIDFSSLTKEQLLEIKKEIEEEIHLFDLSEKRMQRLKKEYKEEREKMHQKLKQEENKLRNAKKSKIEYDESCESDFEEPKKKPRKAMSRKLNK